MQVLRVVVSGVAALAVGGVLYLVQIKAFALSFVLPGTMGAIAASAVLDRSIPPARWQGAASKVRLV